MNILVISNSIPLRDRSGGWRRFYSLLMLLAQETQVTLHACDFEWQFPIYSEDTVTQSKKNIELQGVNITSGKHSDLCKLLKSKNADLVIFEHYTVATCLIDLVRRIHPNTKIVIDTIDLEYKRLSSKAEITKNKSDYTIAKTTKFRELGTYKLADAVLTISDAEKEILIEEISNISIHTVPLIFETHPFKERSTTLNGNLIYIADFKHDANVDGIINFCKSIYPLIDFPNVRLRIVGGNPPKAVTDLAKDDIEVMGYVPDVSSIYQWSDIAIAPMRYGGGLKGKIAEALSFSIPIVTNTTSLAGFSLRPGKDVMVGDSPSEYAEAISFLLRNPDSYDVIRRNGWSHVNKEYSEDAIARKLDEFLNTIFYNPTKRASLGKRINWFARDQLNRHLLWRFRQI